MALINSLHFNKVDIILTFFQPTEDINWPLHTPPPPKVIITSLSSRIPSLVKFKSRFSCYLSVLYKFKKKKTHRDNYQVQKSLDIDCVYKNTNITFIHRTVLRSHSTSFFRSRNSTGNKHAN